jgi:hypothetical protein
LVLPPARVAKQLRLRLTDLKKTDGVPARRASGGARLCIHGAESTLALESVVRAFLEVR